MEVNNILKPPIYLDYNATTPLAEEVITGINHSLSLDWGNPSSGNVYGVKAKAAIEKARNQIANMLSCSPNDLIFTSGGTEGNNTIIFSSIQYFEKYKKKGFTSSNAKPHIITTNVEHDSVILPILQLAELSLITYTIVKVNNNGCLNVEDVLCQITDDTCLITIMYANNETGVIMPINEIGNQLHWLNSKREQTKKIQILFHTDAAQIIGKEKINLEKSNIDFVTIVGHKFYGPRIGCIYVKAPLYPLLFGGGQEKGFRPGTENTSMIVGLGIAAELVSKNIQNYKDHMHDCRDKLESRLKEIFGDEIVINCSKSYRLPNTTNISFRTVGLEGNLILSQCEKLIASVGAACHGSKCSKILINSGIPVELARNAIRLSVGRKTSPQDIEDVVLDLKAAVKKLKTILSIS